MTADVETAVRGPQAYDLARKAVAAMEAHQVWPTPLNFELWLNYVSAKNSPLAQEIDQIIEAGGPFTDDVGEALAAQHLPKAKLSGEILEAGDALSKELDEVTKAIQSAQRSSEAYGEQLATASEQLETKDATQVKAMVETLTSATRRVREENRELETKLADTTAEVRRLHENLEQLRRDAMTDGLTNLPNRKAFDEAMERAREQSDLTGQRMCLAMVDVDHFKGFNDTWGHQTGDQVLRYVGAVLAKFGAAPRLAARYGGEEFAIIFPHDDARTAMGVAEHLREEIASRMLKRRSTNEDLGNITVSLGLAERKPGESAASLIERADAALYASKRSGRNRSTLAETVAAQAAA